MGGKRIYVWQPALDRSGHMAGCRRAARHGGTKNFDPSPAIQTASRDVWLMFAALADQYKWSGYQPSLLLKMSYYTAPNELALLPLRPNVSLHAKGVIDDAELQDMVRRDISVILTRAPALKPALVAAYRSALPQGKIVAERVIFEIDPGYLGVVRAGYP
jgi:hypothetical protein